MSAEDSALRQAGCGNWHPVPPDEPHIACTATQTNPLRPVALHVLLLFWFRSQLIARSRLSTVNLECFPRSRCHPNTIRLTVHDVFVRHWRNSHRRRNCFHIPFVRPMLDCVNSLFPPGKPALLILASRARGQRGRSRGSVPIIQKRPSGRQSGVCREVVSPTRRDAREGWVSSREFEQLVIHHVSRISE